MSNRVLFICTGNFYRSRFAEALFNHQAAVRNLEWRAFSRGLAIHLVAECGPISAHTVEELKAMRIDLSLTGAHPVQVSAEDLQAAHRIIALKEIEHRPMMETQFPAWAGPIEYWHVHDLDMALPEQALAEIKELVGALVEELASVPSN